MEEEIQKLPEALIQLEGRVRLLETQSNPGDLSPVLAPFNVKITNLQKAVMALVDRSTMPPEDKEVLFRLLKW
jgi:hypothetical protein